MKTIKELAQMCNCSKTTINRLIRQLNITTMQDKNRLLVSDEDAEKLQQYVVNDVVNNAPNATQTAPDEIKIAPKIETSTTENAPQQVETATKIETNAPENETQQAKNAPNRNKIAPNCTKTQHIEPENATFNTNRNTPPPMLILFQSTVKLLKF